MIGLDIQTAREMSVHEITEYFLELELLGVSAETRTWYIRRLGLFIDEIGPDRKLSTLTALDLVRWWRQLEARTISVPPTLTVETFHGYVRSVRRLVKWMYDKHLIIDDLSDYVKLPRLPKNRQRRGIMDDNAIHIIDLARDNPRNLAILLFLESTGARRGGVANLRLEDIDVNAPEPLCRRAIVSEKGSKSRIVFMSTEALAAMRAWLDIRQSCSDYVFTDLRKHKTDNRLLPGAINQIIDTYRVKLELSGRCSPHQWRHRWFRGLIKNNIGLAKVQQLGGHSSPVITANIYGTLDDDELQDAYDAAYRPIKT